MATIKSWPLHSRGSRYYKSCSTRRVVAGKLSVIISILVEARGKARQGRDTQVDPAGDGWWAREMANSADALKEIQERTYKDDF